VTQAEDPASVISTPPYRQALLRLLLSWRLLLCSVAIVTTSTAATATSTATLSADSVMVLSVSSAVATLETLDLTDTTAPRSLSAQLLIHKETPDNGPDQQQDQQSERLALAMGGRIQVHSQSDQQPGSLFSIELQVPKASMQDASPARIKNGIIRGYRGPPRTLLIADDMPSSRQFLAESARAWGFEVLLAVNGTDALEQLQAADPKPDAALIDQFMPQLDGWGFLRRVRESSAHATLPVILISAAPLERPEGLPSEITFDAVALKPLSVRTLAEILEQQLELDWDFETGDEHTAEDPEHKPAEPDEDSVARALAADIDDEQLAELRKLISLGAVIAIADWARERRKSHPESAALWQTIERCAIQIDLVRLQSLARQQAPSEISNLSQKMR
jgi:CheY-like chemotaxis protein